MQRYQECVKPIVVVIVEHPCNHVLNASCTKPFGTHTLNQGGQPDLSPPPPPLSQKPLPYELEICRVLETSFNIL